MPRKPRRQQGTKFHVSVEWSNVGGQREMKARVTTKGRKRKAYAVGFWMKDGDGPWKAVRGNRETPWHRKQLRVAERRTPFQSSVRWSKWVVTSDNATISGLEVKP